jgi:DNA polymerase III subunit epsilon
VRDFAVIDFETTGLTRNDRVIEVGVALVSNSEVVDTFSTLMDPGVYLPPEITALTGITPSMLKGKPRPENVMPRLRRFIGDRPCVAHNAAFDRRFYEAEMARASLPCQPRFFCSMLLARRLVQDTRSHALGPLLRHLGLAAAPSTRAHRALDDSLMTATLWRHLMKRISDRLPSYEPEHKFISKLSRVPKANVDTFLSRHADTLCTMD